MASRWTIGVLCGLFALSGGALAQQSEEIVVTGRRLEEAVRSFVGAVTVEAGRSGQLARWDRRVCPGVIGLRGAQAQAIADRIAIRALEVGLDVGEPGCTANILVLVTSDADALARTIVDQNRTLLGYYGDGNTRGREALREFAQTPRAVRWWHVSQTASVDGASLEAGGTRNAGEVATVTLPANALSRINRTTSQQLARAIIIVDGGRVSGASVGTLGDYVAMAALAQLDPDADTSQYPTVLNAFTGASASNASLTEWDVAYLQGLYGSRADRSAASQANAISRAVVEGQTPN